MDFQTGHFVVCDFSHNESNQGGRNCRKSVCSHRISMDLPIINLKDLTAPDCDCSHKIFALLAGSKVAGPGSEVAAWN